MIITLLTDFGVSSPYVAAMKGVILSINPKVTIVDISHNIAPQNIDEAAFVLAQTASHFPTDTIHVVVIDPGVGSDRKILAVTTGKGTFLAPDNSVLKYIFKTSPDATIIKVTNSDYFLPETSNTFHGRDIFAPVAAHLSLGVLIEKLGKPAENYQKGSVLEPIIEDDKITGHIIYFDAFGNAVTNIHADLLQSKMIDHLQIGNIKINQINKTYSEVYSGRTIALLSSSNYLEIAVSHGNAQKYHNLQISDKVIILMDAR